MTTMFFRFSKDRGFDNNILKLNWQSPTSSFDTFFSKTCWQSYVRLHPAPDWLRNKHLNADHGILSGQDTDKSKQKLQDGSEKQLITAWIISEQNQGLGFNQMVLGLKKCTKVTEVISLHYYLHSGRYAQKPLSYNILRYYGGSKLKFGPMLCFDLLVSCPDRIQCFAIGAPWQWRQFSPFSIS